MTARECALKVLFELDQKEAYSDVALKKELAKSGLSQQDRAFATQLVGGVVKHRTRLDYVLGKFSKLNKLSPWILNVVRLGVYQLLYLDNIPPSAVVNECVKLAKRYGHQGTVKFANGVLRNIARQGDVTYPTGQQYDQVYHSHPKWLVELLYDQYGGETARQMIASNNQTPAITVRPNLLRTSGEHLITDLTAQGIEVAETPVSPMLTLSKTGDIAKLDAFQQGLFTPQDIGAYLAAAAVDPQAGEVILDVCAAPGGKTTAMAELSGNQAHIHAFDIHPHRVELIAKNAARLGLTCIIPTEADATVFQPHWEGKADKVLADVPCSGLGILRKKPDIKWHRTAEDLTALAAVQTNILQTSARYVKPGGTLVYATCTVNKGENEGITHPFTEGNPFDLVEERTLLPHKDGCDGFYICILKRW